MSELITKYSVWKAIGTLLTLAALDAFFWILAKQPQHTTVHIPDDCPACTQRRKGRS